MSDAELRDLARRARRASIDATDADADLLAVHRRIASGDTGNGLEMPGGGSPGASPWVLAAAAAAVFGIVAVGILALRGDDPTTLRIDSATVPPTETTVAAVVAPATTVGDTVAPTNPGTTPTSEPNAQPPPTAPPEAVAQLAITFSCADTAGCTQLANTAAGILAYDPTSNALLLLDRTGSTVTDEVPISESLSGRSPYLITVGPDDVAYFVATPLDAGDPIADLVAIPTSGPNAGSLFTVATGLDNSGDTDLVPTPDGIAVVGCCGPEFERPNAEDAVYPWLDRNGEATRSDAPHFVLGLQDRAGLTRIDPVSGTMTSFALPAVAAGPRGMPRLVATDDGGALMTVYDYGTGRTYGIRFRTDWPEFSIDPTDVVLLPEPDEFGDIALLEPSGTVIVRDGDRLIRRELAEYGTPGWPGRLENDSTATEWRTTAPGLNEYIDANRPEWAADPVLLAVQLHPRLGPAERFEATWDESSKTLVTTTSGYLDDSVFATQSVTLLERGTDGLYRFVGSTFGQQCQPGRGQQDFRPEPCL